MVAEGPAEKSRLVVARSQAAEKKPGQGQRCSGHFISVTAGAGSRLAALGHLRNVVSAVSPLFPHSFIWVGFGILIVWHLRAINCSSQTAASGLFFVGVMPGEVVVCCEHS